MSSGLKEALKTSEFRRARKGRTTVERTDQGYTVTYGVAGHVRTFLTFSALAVFLDVETIDSGWEPIQEERT